MEIEKTSDNNTYDKVDNEKNGIQRMNAHQYEKKINELLETIEILESRLLLLNSQRGYAVTKLKDYEKMNDNLQKKFDDKEKENEKLKEVKNENKNENNKNINKHNANDVVHDESENQKDLVEIEQEQEEEKKEDDNEENNIIAINVIKMFPNIKPNCHSDFSKSI